MNQNKNKQTKPNQNSKAYLAGWLAKSERTIFECERRLRLKGYDNEEVLEAINWVIDNNYVNDNTYVEHFLEGPAKRKGYSIALIIKKLRAVGIDTTEIKNKLENNDKFEITAAQTALDKKYKGTHKENKLKAIRFLNSRGFKTSVIMELLN